MSMRKRFAIAIPLALALSAAPSIAADGPGLGHKISEADLALWDISIGPDGRGLPPGSGTAAQGAAIFAEKCEACHGRNGQGGANSVLINAPGKTERTMALYVPHATTVFDFIRRAMPYTQPKSLTASEVYALTAFILAGSKIIDENQVMNAETLPKVNMPNRNGFISRYPEKH
jgi:S-disulfanyl-L-cysteine oxidoreductase SoxD